MHSKANYKPSKIKQLANQFTDSYFDYKTTYVPIIDIARRLGFEVYNTHLEDIFESFMIVEPYEQSVLGFNSNKIIGVNINLSEAQKRCAVARQLAQYLMAPTDKSFNHKSKMRKLHKGRCAEDDLAIEILMPKPLVSTLYVTLKATYRHSGISIAELVELVARGLNVPIDYVMRRLVELSLI